MRAASQTTGMEQDEWVGKELGGWMLVYRQGGVRAEQLHSEVPRKVQRHARPVLSHPIGHRNNGMPRLPGHFPMLPPSCVSNPRVKDSMRCCVGFGLAAALHALGDTIWSQIRDLSVAAVLEVELDEGQGEGSRDEILYFQQHFRKSRQGTYEVYTRSSSFSPDDMMPDDIAVCQVRPVCWCCLLVPSFTPHCLVAQSLYVDIQIRLRRIHVLPALQWPASRDHLA
ncbi:hypothetical protein OAO87_02765 [bacterium]|nr:hypothetical protein [bacterium]